MTAEQKQAYEWAKNQNYQSVAARYAKELCRVIEALQAENAEKGKEIERLRAERDRLLDRAHEAQAERDCARAERDAAEALVDKVHEMLRPGEDGHGYGYAATNSVAYMVYAMIDEWRGAQGEA